MSSLRFARCCAVPACALLLAACGGDTTGPSLTTAPFYWRLQLNHHAVTLADVAPYDTIRLVATPVDAQGHPIATTAQPVYTVTDQHVAIDSTGLARVLPAGADIMNITVVASLTVGDAHPLTLRDTAVLNVIHWSSSSAVPVLDSLLLRPVAGDSARRALDDTSVQIGRQELDNIQAKTAAGMSIDNAAIYYRSSDSLIASFANSFGTSSTAPVINAKSSGVVLLTAEATAYGRRRVDSLWYTVGAPLRITCDYGSGVFQWPVVYGYPIPSNRLSQGTLVVGQGGAVLWANSTQGSGDDSLDIQFDDTTGIVGLPVSTTFPGNGFNIIPIPAGQGGNIPAFPAAVPVRFGEPGSEWELIYLQYDSTTSKARMFTRAGTYHWSSVRQGIHGTVTVVSNDSMFGNALSPHSTVNSK